MGAPCLSPGQLARSLQSPFDARAPLGIRGQGRSLCISQGVVRPPCPHLGHQRILNRQREAVCEGLSLLWAPAAPLPSSPPLMLMAALVPGPRTCNVSGPAPGGPSSGMLIHLERAPWEPHQTHGSLWWVLGGRSRPWPSVAVRDTGLKAFAPLGSEP